MHSLVTTYLDLSRIEAGQLSLKTEPVWLSALLQQIGQQYVLEARRRRVSLTLSLEDVPTPVVADSLALERVFINLLSNAIKFTSEGGSVTVHSVWREREVVVEIRNTGAGILPEELPFLFKKYRRTAASRHREGTGLGLFIVKTFVEAHGGRVEVASTPGQETCFSVTLPLVGE